MGALPRPDLPAGAGRLLNDALHDLHHRSGWPSLRTLARDAGVSHTTVSKVFSTPALPTWGTLEVLVEALGGDTSTFHDLWLAASTPTDDGDRDAPRIAGRRTELSAVRRHLETGTGLLLVTGEAGIGKTSLVTTAARTTDIFVATGHCLPLSTQAPLMPVADALRDVLESDGGRWLEEAVAGSPPWVAGNLSRILPELAPQSSQAVDSSPTHLVGVAVRSVLSALSHRRPLGVALEDLHWADTATLELLEHLLTRATVPLIGTWRLDDPHTAEPNTEWFTRVRRMPSAVCLPLSPMTRTETGEQLALLLRGQPSREVVDAIHSRSLGLPLFTEQLAAQQQGSSTEEVPDLLTDLLDTRLGALAGDDWRAARTLGVADRALTSDLVAAASGVQGAALSEALHALKDRHLLATTADSTVALRHPLLAEAIRRRLVPGEAEMQHAEIARALAGSAGPVPAEVAGHWAAAGDTEQELVWRIRAAQAAHDRFAVRHEMEQWARVVELWPSGMAVGGDPPLRQYDVLVAALDLIGGLERSRATRMVERALPLVPQLLPHEAAELLQRAGDFLSMGGETDRGMQMIRRALATYERGLPCEGHVRALFVMEFALRRIGRYEEAATAVRRGVEVAAALDDRTWLRRMLVQEAWMHARNGDRSLALRRAREAAEVDVPGPDPRGEALLAGTTTDILLLTAGDVEDVVRAGTRGLTAVEAWGWDTWAVTVIRYNMALAMRRSGQVSRAVEFLAGSETNPTENLLDFERAVLQTLQGHAETALSLVAALDDGSWTGLEGRIECQDSLAEVDFWTGREVEAFRRLVEVIADAAPTEAAQDLGPLFALAARAAADARDASAYALLRSLHGSCTVDPFVADRVPVDSRAWGLTWQAEMARLRGEQTIEQWTSAATAWDRLTRPHEAAYCRWRAAEVAVHERQGTVAARLLKRAATDAREHLPLYEAIAKTAARAPSDQL